MNSTSNTPTGMTPNLTPETVREVMDRHVGVGFVPMDYEDRRTLRECADAWEADRRRLEALEAAVDEAIREGLITKRLAEVPGK